MELQDMQSEQDLQEQPIQETIQESPQEQAPAKIPNPQTSEQAQGEDPPSKKLWQTFVDNEMYSGTFEDFQKGTSTKDQIDNLYLGLIDNEAFSGSKDSFYKNFFPNVSQEFEQPQEDAITATLKANALKNKKKITETTIYDPMMGDVVTQTEDTDIDANKEGLKLESDLEKRGYKKEQRDQLLNEWADIDMDLFNKMYKTSEFEKSRNDDYVGYKRRLNAIKTGQAIRKVAGVNASNEFVNAHNVVRSRGGSIDKLSELENNYKYKIGVIDKYLTGDEKQKAIDRENEDVSLWISQSVTPQKAEEYLNNKLYGSDKQFAPSEVTPFTPDQVPFGGDIKQLSLESVAENLDPNNPVEQVVFNKYKYGVDLKKSIENTATFDDAAVEFGKLQNPQIAGYSETIELPNITKGKLVKQWLENPDVIQMVQQNPELLKKYNDTKVKFESNYPELVTESVREKISNKRQELGWGNAFADIPNKDNADELAKQMHENGELTDQEYFQYGKNISPELGYGQSALRGVANIFGMGATPPLKTADAVSAFGEGLNQGMRNLAGGAYDILSTVTPLFVPIEDKIEAGRLYRNVLNNEKAWELTNTSELQKWAEKTGHITGGIVPIIMGGELTALAKAPALATEIAAGGLNFEGGNREASMVLYPGKENEFKRTLYTYVSTLGDATLMRFIPTKKIAAVFKKDAAAVIEDLGAKKITEEAAKNKILDLGYKIAKENAKTAGVLTGFETFHKAVDAMFNGEDLSVKGLALDAIKSYKSNFLSAPIISTLAVAGANKFHGKVINEMAENPEPYSKFITDKMIANPDNIEIQKQGNDQLENLRVSTDILSDINQTDLTQAQKEKYLLNGVAQNIYERRAKETKDENVAKLYLEKAKEFADKKKKIFDGKDEAKEFETFGNEEETNEIKKGLDEKRGVTEEVTTKEVVTEEGEKLPVVEETVTEKVLPEEKDITIGDVVNKKGNYKGEEGTFYQDGQTVVFAVDGTNREYEIGSIKEIKDTPIKDFGIEHKESVVSIGDEGQVLVRDKEYKNNYSDPMMAINRDKEGNVVSVTLDTPSGQKRTFKGNVAEDLAYQIHLKEINKNNETRADFEQHINEDATAQKEINNAGIPEAPKAGAVENIQPVQREKIQPIVKVAAPTPKAKAPTPTPTKAPEKKPLTKQQEIAQRFLQEVEGVKPEAKKSAPPKVHTVENIDKIDTKGYNETQNKALSSAKEIVKSIANLVKESTKKKLEVVIHDNKETYTDEVIKAGGTRQDSESKGFYLGKDGKIHLNMELVSSETLKHEAFHPVLDFMADNNPKIIDDLHNQLKNLPGGQKVVDRAERTYKGDDPTTIKKEAITDYIARVADGSISLDRNTWQQVKDYVLTALNKLGINLSKKIESISDLQELAREISRKFQTGEEVKTKGKADALKTLTSMQKQATTFGKSGIVKKPALDSKKSDEAIKSGRVKVISPKDSLKGLTFAITHWDDLFVGDIFMGKEKIGSFDGGVFYPLNGGDKGKMGASVSTGSAGAFASQANRSLFINNGIKLPENFSDGSFVVSKGKGERDFVLTNKKGEKFELTLPENPNPGVVVMGKGSDLKHKTSLAAKVGFVKTLLSYAKGKEGYDGLVNAIKSTYSIGNVKNADGIIELFNNYLKGGRMADGQTMSEANSSYDSFRTSLVKNANPIITKMLRDMGYDENSYFLDTEGEKQFVFDRTKWKKGEYKASGAGVDKMFMDLGQEDFLKGLETGDAYAALKIKSPVFFEEDASHPSYPFAIKTIDASPVGIDIFNKTFRTFGKNQGVTGREVKEGKEETGGFGVTTTTKPTFKIKEDLNLDDPSSKGLNDSLANYESISRVGAKTEKFGLNLSSATLRESSPEIKALYENAKQAFDEGRFDEANKIYTEILDKGEESLKKAFNKIDGAEIKLERSKGNYFGGEEPTFIGELKITDPSKRQEAFSAIADFGDIHSQEAIHVSKVLDKLPEGAELGKENEDGSVYEPNVDIRFDKPLTDAEYKALSEFIQTIGEKDKEIAGSTLHTDKKGINLYNISKFKDHETFTDQIAELIQKLQDDGRILSSVEEKVRQLWNYGESEGAGGSTRTYEQLRGGDLPSQIFPEKGKVYFSKVEQSQQKPQFAKKGGEVEAIAKALEQKLKENKNIFDDIFPKSYHGRRGEIIFDENKPMFFTDDINGAKWYSEERGDFTKEPNIFTANVEIKNPFKIESKNDALKFINIIKKAGFDLKIIETPYGWNLSKESTKPIRENSPYDGENLLDWIYVPKVKKQLIKEGYDGIKAFDVLGNEEIPIKIPFKKSQIKEITAKNISEAYYKAKADGTNPELVKAVEDLIGKQAELPQQKPQLSKAENKASSMMRELVQSHLDEGKSLDEIKEEIKKDFGAFYDKHEALLEQTYQDLTTTSIKNVVTKAERAARGLDEVEVEMKRGFGDVVDNAKRDIEEGKISPELLAAEIAKKPRPLSAEESAALLIDRVKVSNQYDAKFKQLQDAYDKGDINQAKVIESQLFVLEERMQINDEASRKSGYEQGLGLAARRMLMARDYSLATQLARAKAANGGKELPKEVRKKFEELTQKLKDANAKLDEYETKEAKRQLDKEVKATKKSTSSPEQIAKQKESVKETIFGKLKNFLKGAVTPKAKEGESGAMYSKAPAMTPEQEAKAKYLTEISGDVKKLVKLYAEGGNRNLDNIINDIHKDISAQFPEVTKEDIQDVVVGNYNKVKVATPLDATKLAIQANVKRVQNEIDLLRDNLALKQRGKGEMFMDYLHGWHRFALLSSIPSIPKIAGAALGRGITSRLEGVIGQGLSYVPGLRGIAKGAIREGRLSPKAEAKAFAQWFDKMTFEDLKNIYKTGMSDLDIQYGDKKEFAAKVPEWMEFFGRMHSMIKYLPKRAEFFRSMEMRAEQAIKEGKDPKDPMVQYELGLEAYNDATRAIFMQDNWLTDMYKGAIQGAEKSESKIGKTAVAGMKFIFPIVKVPTNYVMEQSSYALGGIKAGSTLINAALAFDKGIKGLTPQEKDNVMRALKKQTIGIAIALLGYYNSDAIGGYYTGKRKEGDLEAGDIVVFGVKLPHWAAHTPLLEMLQVGATIRRAMDAKDEKSKYKGKWTKFGEGTFDAAIESIKKIPFFGTGERIAKVSKDEDMVSKYINDMASSIVVPQALKNAAEFFDKEEGGEEIEREPSTLVETLKTKVPVLREQVPIKKTYSFLKEKDYEDEDFKILKDNGITVGIGKRTAINVGFSKEHPDGHMTEEEYDKYYEEANNYIKNGGVVTDEEGNQKTIPSLKEFLNSNADMTLTDIYGDEVSTESSLVKDLPTSPMTIEQGGKKIEAKGLDNPLQDAIDAYKSDVFKAVKEKMKLVPKTYKSKLNLEYKEFNKD